MTLSLENKISALYICADILDYPDNHYRKRLDEFSQLTNLPIEYDDLESAQAEYLQLFSINATKLRCVPVASWWIDGVMGGISLSRINDFYRSCGYAFDTDMIKKPVDHISLMITFVAILMEENRVKEIKEFSKFLTWVNDFANSLDEASDIKYFKEAANVSTNIINSLKEEI